jgi:hypothetical protein
VTAIRPREDQTELGIVASIRFSILFLRPLVIAQHFDGFSRDGEAPWLLRFGALFTQASLGLFQALLDASSSRRSQSMSGHSKASSAPRLIPVGAANTISG